MIQLKTIDFYSGILPSGDVVTLFTGNERAFDDADAAWLLAEYPDRFTQVALDAPAVSVDKAKPDAPPTPDPSLQSRAAEMPEEIEKFGATARRKRGN